MKKLLALALTLMMALSLTACGGGGTTTPPASSGGSAAGEGGGEKTPLNELVFAVEEGSAGMAAAEENAFEYNAVTAQSDALMEVAAGTSDAAIIDLLMAGAMIGEGTSYPNLIHTAELTTEEYGVGCRKGSDLAAFINGVFASAYADGSMMEIANTYGVQEAIIPQKGEAVPAATGGDVAYIQGKGTLVIGITDFAPMDYKDESGNWIGFDADMAKVVAEALGVEAQFVEINWDNKILELENKSIDVVWNGMTLTNEVKSAMECTNAYCNNAQVVVIPAEKADAYADRLV